MGAVINELRRQNPATRVIYTTGVDFVNHMVKCISRNEMESFRNHYRSCDVLLIDDIQFIAGKESTQNEVFHTFQTLFDEGKQIILASDRPPKDIHPLEERLRSRFEQGLLADINPPNLELRVAIIKKKAEDMSIDLPPEVLSYLAENLRSNIRQLEGAIKKLAAKSLVDGRLISLEMARDCIGDLLGDTEPLNVTIDKIFAAVYKKYNIAKDEIVGKRRNKEIANARHVAIYLIREITEISLPNIGKIFDRDHSTVMSSLDWVKRRIMAEPIFNADIENLRKEIQGR
jgi:chromosomal replication initiator protein